MKDWLIHSTVPVTVINNILIYVKFVGFFLHLNLILTEFHTVRSKSREKLLI